MDTTIIGKTFNYLTVTDYSHSTKSGTYWKTLCVCGIEKIVQRPALVSGATASCGCMRKDKTSLIGKTFGRLTVTAFSHIAETDRRSYWMTKCECGTNKAIRDTNLKNGNATSCGCYGKEFRTKRWTKHGEGHTLLWERWRAMKYRCNPINKDRPQYASWAGKGIKVCDEWRDDFMKFKEWADANGYQDGLSIDRENNDLDYCPSNCRWVPEIEQNRNKANVKLNKLKVLEIRNNEANLSDKQLAEKYRVSIDTIYQVRTKRLWNFDESKNL